MKGPQAPTEPSDGASLWSAREYVIHERAGPFGRRFEVRDAADALILQCRVKKSETTITFHTGGTERELFRLEPTKVRLFQRAYDVIESPTGAKLGQIRKKEYAPLQKTEWFIFNPEGEQVGLVTETAREPSLLRRVVPMERLWPKAWALHWGQSIGGTIQPRSGIVGDRLMVDLKLDIRDEVDRRLALGTLIAMRIEPRAEEPAPPAS